MAPEQLRKRKAAVNEVFVETRINPSSSAEFSASTI
jgi:hypothetical protein